MKLYTVTYAGETFPAAETAPGTLARLPYGTMNDLLTDDPARRDGVLAGLEEGTIPLSACKVLAPIPSPRQDVICLGMNYQKHKTEAELFINYLLRGDVSAKLTTEFPYVCFNTAAVEYLPEELAKSELCLLSDDIKSRIYMLNTFNGEAIAAEIDAMVEVKTSR